MSMTDRCMPVGIAGTSRNVRRLGRPRAAGPALRVRRFKPALVGLSIALLVGLSINAAKSPAATREGSGWRRLPGSRFSVVGNASDGDLRKVGQEIQLFR